MDALGQDQVKESDCIRVESRKLLWKCTVMELRRLKLTGPAHWLGPLFNRPEPPQIKGPQSTGLPPLDK